MGNKVYTIIIYWFLLLYFINVILCQKTTTMYVTSYGFDDNSPPSDQIAYPKDDGYPTVHNFAYEGSGAYNDPITMASYKAEIPIGTFIYVPFLRKYFVMEDLCGECEKNWQNGQYHVDLWQGPDEESNEQALEDCENKITRSATPVIINPAQNLPVETTHLFTNGQCTAVIFPVTTSSSSSTTSSTTATTTSNNSSSAASSSSNPSSSAAGSSGGSSASAASSGSAASGPSAASSGSSASGPSASSSASTASSSSASSSTSSASSSSGSSSPSASASSGLIERISGRSSGYDIFSADAGLSTPHRAKRSYKKTLKRRHRSKF